MHPQNVAIDPKRLCATNREQDHTHGSLIVIVILRAIERTMRRFILPIFLIATFSAPCVAQVQSGSVGGTVGKQDKSISGGAELDRPRAAPQPKRSATKSQEKSSGQSCDRIVGNWTWYLGVTEMVFNQDGTARNSGGGPATWTCTGGRAVVTFRGGPSTGAVDHVTISHDGNSLVVHSQFNGGLTFTATRKS